MTGVKLFNLVFHPPKEVVILYVQSKAEKQGLVNFKPTCNCGDCYGLKF